MCRECGWEKIKLKCKICGEIIAKGDPRLLAHAAAHYATSELLYNEEADQNIIFVNFESSKISNETFGENGYDYALRCKICGDRFTFKKKR
jgi:ribosomal protein S27E